MSLTSGTKLGPYEILAPLGAGGMGEVYRARDSRLDREVAIKVLPSHLSQNPDLRARFEREAKAISGLQHPNICVLYGRRPPGWIGFSGDGVPGGRNPGGAPATQADDAGRDSAHRNRSCGWFGQG